MSRNIDGKRLFQKALSFGDAGELEVWLKSLAPAEIDAMIKADGEGHYRVLSPAERSSWGALCGVFH